MIINKSKLSSQIQTDTKGTVRLRPQIAKANCGGRSYTQSYPDVTHPLWDMSINKIEEFLLKANNFHPTIKFMAEISERESTFLDTKVQGNRNARKKILPFVTQYHPALPNLKDTIMGKWHLIESQPQLRNIFKEPPIISYRKGKSLKDILVRAKLWRL